MKHIFTIALLFSLLGGSFTAEAQKTKTKAKPAKVKKEKKSKQNSDQLDIAQPGENNQTGRPQITPVPSEPVRPAETGKPELLPTKPVKDQAQVEPVKPGAQNPQNLEVFEQHTKPVVKPVPNGEVNWTTQYVTAKGQSVIDNERFKNPAQAKAMARRGAIVEGQRNLLEIIKGVNVVGETKVKDMIAESDYIYTRVDGVIKGAEVVGEPIEKDGLIEVTMRVPLYQANGLAPVFYDGQTNTATARLGKPVGAENAASASAVSAVGEAAPKFAFNLNGHNFDPSLFPVLVDENSNLLFDLSKLYDPTKGKFPQLVQTTRNTFEKAGFQKGVEVIDIIKTAPGKLVVDGKTKDKIMNWSKIGKTMFDIGKLLLLII